MPQHYHAGMVHVLEKVPRTLSEGGSEVSQAAGGSPPPTAASQGSTEPEVSRRAPPGGLTASEEPRGEGGEGLDGEQLEEVQELQSLLNSRRASLEAARTPALGPPWGELMITCTPALARSRPA